jgi:hypothetical protein
MKKIFSFSETEEVCTIGPQNRQNFILDVDFAIGKMYHVKCIENSPILVFDDDIEMKEFFWTYIIHIIQFRVSIFTKALH